MTTLSPMAGSGGSSGKNRTLIIGCIAALFIFLCLCSIGTGVGALFLFKSGTEKAVEIIQPTPVPAATPMPDTEFDPVDEAVNGDYQDTRYMFTPERRKQIRFVEPLGMYGFVPVENHSEWQIRPVGHIPIGLWATEVGPYSGGLIPIEIILPVPAYLLDANLNTEVRYQEASNQDLVKALDAFVDWRGNGLSSISWDETKPLINPKYRHGEASEYENIGSWPFDDEWFAVTIYGFAQPTIEAVVDVVFNKPPHIEWVNTVTTLTVGESALVSVIAIDPEADEWHVEFEGCDARPDNTCLVVAGDIVPEDLFAPSTELRTTQVVTATAVDRWGAYSFITHTIEVIKPAASPTPTPTPTPTIPDGRSGRITWPTEKGVRNGGGDDGGASGYNKPSDIGTASKIAVIIPKGSDVVMHDDACSAPRKWPPNKAGERKWGVKGTKSCVKVTWTDPNGKVWEVWVRANLVEETTPTPTPTPTATPTPQAVEN